MNGKHHTRTEPGDSPDESKPSHFGGLTDAVGLGPATPEKDVLLGRVIGGVTIMRLIAEGGMGRVYEGLQDKPRRPVAVKVMRPGFVSREACRRFDNEAEVLGRLRHPCIAQIYSAGIYEMMGAPVPYFIMEYIPNALPITKFAAVHGLTTAQRLQLFREVCDAVAEGHKQGIVHRDLKPSNILVEPSKSADRIGNPKIIDFGVARSIDASPEAMTGMTDMGRLIGTLQYMSPEQFLGDPAGIDVRADVYALGVILYELLAGQPPYEIRHEQIFEAARIVREQTPKPVTATNRSVGREVAQVADTCLKKDPRQRYANAGELAGAVKACLEAPAAAPSPESEGCVRAPTTAVRAWIGRYWRQTLSSVTAICIGLLCLNFWRNSSTDLSPSAAQSNTGQPAATPAAQAAPAAATPVSDVVLDGSYEARRERVRKRDELVPQKLVGYPEKYLVCSTENEPSRDRETGDLVVPLQLSFDRAKFLTLARELAALLMVDDDRCGTVVCDNAFWQTEPSAGVTDQEKARQKLNGQWARGQNWGIGVSVERGSRGGQSLQLRAGEVYPAHRGWNELHTYYTSMSKEIVSGQYGYPSGRYGDVILILLVDCAEDFSRTTWKWFRLTQNEFVDLFGYVWTTSQPEEDTLRPAMECILSVSGPNAKVIASDNFRLSGPGLTRMNPELAPFAVLAPFYVSLTQHFDIEGSPIDWFVPHWFIERRLPLPETAPPKLRVSANLKRPNELPTSAKSMVIENAIGMKLVRISEGSFRKEVLGPSRGGYIGKRPNSGRVIDVRIGKPFLISQTEVTNAQWRTVMGGPYLTKHEAIGKSGSSPDDIISARLKEPRTIPVSVWGSGLETIREFCDKLTTLDRQKGLISQDERYTLPTECQWEYAFVAGGDFVYLDDTNRRADEGSWLNARNPGPVAPHPVGLLKPNAWGLYDMIGNLVELCDNGEDNRKWADERCDDPAYGKWVATWADFPERRYVLRGGHCWEHLPNASRVGLRVVRINTKDP